MKNLCNLHALEHPGDFLLSQRIPQDGTVPVPLCDFCGTLPALVKVSEAPAPKIKPPEGKPAGTNQ